MIRSSLRRFGHVLLHTGDTPERTAAAYAAGVFIGFSPLLGIHTVLALLVAFVFRLNRLATLAGAYSNLPWLIAPYYVATTAVGAWLLGHDVPADLGARIDALMAVPGWRAQLEGLFTLIQPFFWAYALGSSLGCTLLAGASYGPAVMFLRRRRRTPPASSDFRLPG